MVEPTVPAEVVALAQERSRARQERDWPRADELRSRIEAAGWRVVDDGYDFTLRPERTPDLVEDGRTSFGSVASVPSRLSEPPTAAASIIVIATGGRSPDSTLGALAALGPPGVQVIVVADRQTTVEGPADEVVRTTESFTAGDALEAGLRRAAGAVIVVLEPGRVPTGEIVAPLLEALADPSVAVAAADGLVSSDLRHYHPATSGDATTVGPGCYAFRRDEAAARGPVDGRLHLPGSVAAWLGLRLRDGGSDTEPRRACVVELPLTPAPEPAELPDDHARLARRDHYRIADRFRHQRWLAATRSSEGQVDEPPGRGLVGDRTEDHEGHDEPDEAGHAGQA